MTVQDKRQAIPHDQIGQLLLRAYPTTLLSCDGSNLYWQDGSAMSIGGDGSADPCDADGQAPSIAAQFASSYPWGNNYVFAEHQSSDSGRARNMSFFKKMYGADQAEVEANLVEIRWMPRSRNRRILVSRINGVDRQLAKVSEELDRLPRSLRKFVTHIGGTYNWRTVAGSKQLSPHAFGIAIDIDVTCGNYWHSDNTSGETTEFRNRIPQQIVNIFERHGFIWGGKWKHYDTMHFEFRPELIMAVDPAFGKPGILFLSRERALYGAERQLLYLLDGLETSRFHPVVVHAEADSGDTSAPTRNGSTYLHSRMQPWRKLSCLFARYIDAFRLLQLAHKNSIQLIHCSYQWMLPYALFVARRMQVPVVLHIRRPNNSPRKLRQLGCHACDAVIAVSARIKRELLAAGVPASRVHLIPDAVDLSAFDGHAASSLRRELGIDGQVLFGLVSRINKSKRQLDFVRAASNLLDNGHDARFVLVGRIDDPDYWHEVEKFIAANNLADKVFAIGHRDDTAPVIAAIDVLVSLAGGSVMYEAMASGRTVISAGFSRPEDSTHVIDGVTGLVTESRDNDVLISLMERALLDRDLRDKLGKAAQERARSHFATTALVEATTRIYENLLTVRD